MSTTDESVDRISAITEVSREKCAVALDRCGNDEQAAVDYVLTHQDESQEFWNIAAPEGDAKKSPKALLFERWGDTFQDATAETVSEIVAECLTTGEQFTDPAFPPNDESLFFDPVASRASWRCHDCNKLNSLPNQKDLPQEPTESQVREFFQFISLTNPAMAIAIQQNPRLGVQLMAGSMGSSSGRAVSRDLVCKYCNGKFPLRALDSIPTHWRRPASIQDDVTMQYGSGAPWKVIRDKVHMEDVRQGAVGNCWFVGALSILAHQHPELVHSLFPLGSDLLSESGVYYIRLCKDGVWRNVIVDDHLPCTKYGTLCYTNAARRQLWVPLVEKAAAKLFGCYEGMHSGTICEAFSLLTGCATERDMLPNELSEEESETLWARVQSAHSAKYLVGLACAPTANMSATALHAAGLQAPHAYVLLDTREVDSTKLCLMGNPWGERSPTTWTGQWGNASAEYKKAVREGSLPAASNDFGNNGQFWMSWTDVVKHFASIEMCRTGTDESKVGYHRLSGWLPAVTGLGDVFMFRIESAGEAGTVRVDLSLYQESNATRESALGAASTNIDLGFALIDSKGNTHAIQQRKCLHESSLECFLRLDEEYSLVPLSFGNAFVEEHRKVVVVLRVTGESAVSLKKTKNSADTLRLALHAYCDALGASASESTTHFPGLRYSLTKDSAGAIIRYMNESTCMFVDVTFDGDDSRNISSTRPGMVMQDVLPPARQMIAAVLTVNRGASKYGLAMRVGAARNTSAMNAVFMPPIGGIDDLPDIVGIHTPTVISDNKLIPLREIASRTTDPTGQAVMMRLLMRQQQDINRLHREYIEAGIDPQEALQIATEEAEHMYH